MDPDIKFVLSIIGILLTLAAYVPYLRGIFNGETKPHAYTWLIWFLTVGTAAAGMMVGGAGLLASGPFILGTVLVFFVFILSFWYGTKNVTRSDGVVLALALCAILLWWLLDNPLLAVLMVTGIDAFGYLPTYRKLWSEPWSESISAWALFAASPFFAILAVQEYNLLTVTYGAMTVIANLLLIALSLYRRRIVEKPATHA